MTLWTVSAESVDKTGMVGRVWRLSCHTAPRQPQGAPNRPAVAAPERRSAALVYLPLAQHLHTQPQRSGLVRPVVVTDRVHILSRLDTLRPEVPRRVVDGLQ